MLEALRQPLEEGHVRIARAGGVVTFPARFQLIAAMNPCPCGYAGSLPEGRCRCTPDLVERYERRVSGPLRDRIDLWVTMTRIPAGSLVAMQDAESTAVVAPRIAAARARSVVRNGGLTNGRLHGRALRSACGLDEAVRRRTVELADNEAASGRGTERLLRVARTIADLDRSAEVQGRHIDEAAYFRSSTERAADALAS